jgi:hypothetical protein
MKKPFQQKIKLAKKTFIYSVFLLLSFVLFSCVGVPEERKDFGFSVNLPFMRMEPNECYYLDDFIPTPDSMVTGKSGGLFLRYYTYKSAVYKVWEKEKIMLAFYSRDNRCWSLFEEYAAMRF